MGEQLSIQEIDEQVFKYLDQPLALLALDQVIET